MPPCEVGEHDRGLEEHRLCPLAERRLQEQRPTPRRVSASHGELTHAPRGGRAGREEQDLRSTAGEVAMRHLLP